MPPEEPASETPAPEAETPQEGEPKVFDEAYVKKLRDEAAKHRTDAKANAKAADELAAIKKSQQTDAERAAAELAEARDAASKSETKALRFQIASEFGIDAARADLLLNGSDEETMRAQADAVAGSDKEKRQQGNYVPNEGTTPESKPDGEREFVRDLFGNGP